MMWEVHFGGKVRRWTEEDLRNKLRKNKVSGVELARRVGDDEWTPLYATDLYRETVPHTGDPKSGVLRRIWSPFIGHSTAFVTVLGALWLVSGEPPLWGAWWGIGLAFHAVAAITATGKIHFPQTTQIAAAMEAVFAKKPAVPKQTRSPALLPDNEVLRALEELEQAGWSGDIQALRETALLLVQRRTLVTDATDANAKEALEHERVTVVADREQASPSTQALLDDQLGAIDARLSFLRDIDQLAIRLRAQERTLLHQVESLRLGQIRSTEDTSGPDVMEAVIRLRRELDAESEVTNALARARQTARQ